MVKTKQKDGELVFGVHPIIELLKAKRRKIYSIYTTKPEPKAWSRIKKLWPPYPVPIQYVGREALSKIAGTDDHQGILAWAQPYPFRRKPFEPSKQPFLIMLDGLQDTRNVGAIIRSAYCTGVSGVVLTQKGSAPLTAAALKASSGLAERLEIYQAPSAQAAAQELSNAGYKLYMAAFDGQDATQVDFQGPLCLVIGNEATGISPDVLRQGTQVTLAQRAPDASYNASVAAAILLFMVSSKIGALSK